MMPTSSMPSGVMARPSMPLLVTRPLVLPAISVAPLALRLAMAKLAGKANDLMRWPVVRSNWYT